MLDIWHLTQPDNLPLIYKEPMLGYSGILMKVLNEPDTKIEQFELDPRLIIRIVKGHTDTLCDTPGRRIVFFTPAFLAPTIEDLLIPVGYPEAEITAIKQDKTIPLHMSVTHMDLLGGELLPATWKNLCNLAEQTASPENLEEIVHIQFARAN